MTPRPSLAANVVSAVNHPVRRRILEVLDVDGPLTASLLSERVEEAVGNVSHHLKVLARAGLIAEVPELARDRRERWWRHLPPRGALADVPPAHAMLTEATDRQSLSYRADKVLAWWRDRASYPPVWADAAYSQDLWLKLTPTELADLSRRLDALFDEVRTRSTDTTAAGHTGPDSAEQREPVFVFAYAVPAKP